MRETQGTSMRVGRLRSKVWKQDFPNACYFSHLICFDVTDPLTLDILTRSVFKLRKRFKCLSNFILLSAMCFDLISSSLGLETHVNDPLHRRVYSLHISLSTLTLGSLRGFYNNFRTSYFSRIKVSWVYNVCWETFNVRIEKFKH